VRRSSARWPVCAGGTTLSCSACPGGEPCGPTTAIDPSAMVGATMKGKAFETGPVPGCDVGGDPRVSGWMICAVLGPALRSGGSVTKMLPDVGPGEASGATPSEPLNNTVTDPPPEGSSAEPEIAILEATTIGDPAPAALTMPRMVVCA